MNSIRRERREPKTLEAIKGRTSLWVVTKQQQSGEQDQREGADRQREKWSEQLRKEKDALYANGSLAFSLSLSLALAPSRPGVM